tara:strand:+ start:1389 stop:3356 length:1968 start_codon:yes stop_codon:yes gene_type:complete
MPQVYLPQSSGNNWTIARYDLDDPDPKLETLFLEFLLVEETRGELDELDNQIRYMDDYFDDKDLKYTKETIEALKKLSKEALKKVKEMNLGTILNKIPYDTRIKEETKKIEDRAKKEGMSDDEVQLEIGKLINKYKNPIASINGLLKLGMGADFDKVFPYDIDEVGNVTDRQITNATGEVIETVSQFLIGDVVNKPKSRRPKTRRVGALTPKEREAQDKIFNLERGGKPLQIWKDPDESGEGTEYTTEASELRDELGLKEEDKLTTRQIYDYEAEKYGYATMPIKKEIERFKDEYKIMSTSLDVKKKKITLKFQIKLDYIDPSKSNSKLKFLEKAKLNINTVTVNNTSKEDLKSKISVTINKDDKVSKILQKGIYGEVKDGELETDTILETEREEMVRGIIDETNFDMLLPKEALNPFLLADVTWDFEIDMTPLLTAKEDEELKLTFIATSNWETEYKRFKTGQKTSTPAALTGQKTLQPKRKEEAGEGVSGEAGQLLWQKGEFTDKEIKEAEKEGRLPKKKLKNGDTVQQGDAKKLGQEEMFNINTGQLEPASQSLLNALRYPKEHPEAGKIPQLGDDKYPDIFYDSVGESLEGGEFESEIAEGSRRKVSSGVNVEATQYKISRYFDKIDKRLTELIDAVSNINNHKPTPSEDV